MRNNPLYYINPSSLSVIPNANGNAQDIAVHVEPGAKMRVYCKNIPEFGYADDKSFREWTLSGRNRRLSASGNPPYTVYARLSKTEQTGYLVFAPKTEAGGEWQDKYEPVTMEGGGTAYEDYWYIRLGNVTEPTGGQRELTLDTGILGTDQYNNDWQMIPDRQPLRVVIINSKASGTPYVEWGGQITLTPHLIRGWDTDADDMVTRWVITRDTGDAAADEAWNHPSGPGSDREILNGFIILNHPQTGTDDMNGAVSATFHITAYGPDPTGATQDIGPLDSGDITILAETLEQYELVTSSDIVSYDDTTGSRQPDEDIDITVNSIKQNGEMSRLTLSRILSAGLRLFCHFYTDDDGSSDSGSSGSGSSGSGSSDSDSSEEDLPDDSELEFDADGVARLPVRAFSASRRNARLILRKTKGELMEDVAARSIGYTQSGKSGESPYAVQTDLVMSSVRCNQDNHPISDTSLSVNVRMYQGKEEVQFIFSNVWYNGARMTWSAALHKWVLPDSGVSAGYDGQKLTVYYTTSATIAEKDEISVEVQSVEEDPEDAVSRLFVLTVTAVQDAKPASVLELSTSGFFYDASSSGKAVEPKTRTITIRLRAGDNYCSFANASDITVSLISGVTKSGPSIRQDDDTTASVALNIAAQAGPSGIVRITASGTYGGQTYTASGSVAVEPIKRGAVGPSGKTGKFTYFGGVFDKTDDQTIFIVNDLQSPYFLFNTAGGEQKWAYTPGENPEGGETTMADMIGDPTEGGSSAAYWTRMTDEFNYLITKAMFAEGGMLGSAIFSGDWEISGDGQIGLFPFNGKDIISAYLPNNERLNVSPYTLFDSTKPTSDGDYLAERSDFTEWQIGPAPTPSDPDSWKTAETIGTYELEAGVLYFIRTDFIASGEGRHLMELYLHGGNPENPQTHISGISMDDGTYEQHPKIIFFRVSLTGSYTFRVYAEKVDNKWGALHIERWILAIARFAPRYAVDLKTGMVLQGYGFSSGAIRRNRTIIDSSTVDYYTLPYGQEARELNLDLCGSWVDIRFGHRVLLQLPMYCRGGGYTTAEKDRARSFVGTKILIYITDGRIDYYDGNTTLLGQFCYRHAKDDPEEELPSREYAVIHEVSAATDMLQGYFLELECYSDLDAEGYEVIAWRVNTNGRFEA